MLQHVSYLPHTHSIAASYIHFAPEENPKYLSHFGRFATDWINILNTHYIY